MAMSKMVFALVCAALLLPSPSPALVSDVLPLEDPFTASAFRAFSGYQVNSYELIQVATIPRPPMGRGLERHQAVGIDELLIGMVTNHGDDGLGYSPLWAYSEQEGAREIGRFGIRDLEGVQAIMSGDVIHVTPESNGNGMLDYELSSDLSSWTCREYSAPSGVGGDWGFNYISPDKSEQFLGWGRADNPGIVRRYQHGNWDTYAVLEGGYPTGATWDPERGELFISCVRREPGVWAWNPETGEVALQYSFEGWQWVDGLFTHDLMLLMGGEGVPLWASYADASVWTELVVRQPDGAGGWATVGGDEMEGPMYALSEHPVTGRPILWAAGEKHGYGLGVYELHQEGGDWVAYQVAAEEHCAGVWSAAAEVYKDGSYFVTGLADVGNEDLPDDSVPGVIYKLETVLKGAILQ